MSDYKYYDDDCHSSSVPLKPSNEKTMNKYMKEEKIKCLQEQIGKLQEQIEELSKPETMYVVVTNHNPDKNWYNTGEVYKVFTKPVHDSVTDYLPLVTRGYVGIHENDCVIITDEKAIEALETSEIKNRN